MTYKTVSTAYRFLTIAVMASLFLGISSCSKDEEDELRNSDIAKITSLTLGSVTCNPESGEAYSYSASGYNMTVDDEKSFIYNVDSLVYRTDITKIPCTFYTVNYGTVMVQGINGGESYFMDNGSFVDFSQPRTFTVVSSNGQVRRDYTVDVRVHQQNGNLYRWTCVSEAVLASQVTEAKMLFVGDNIVTLQKNLDNTYELITSADKGATWQPVTGVTVPLNATSMIGEMDGKLYVQTGNSMQHSADLKNWSSVSSVSGGTMNIKALLGGADNALYAVNDKDSIVIAKENGNGIYTWKTDSVLPPLYKDDEGKPYIEKGDSLPHSDFNFSVGPMRSNNEVKQAFIIANKKNDYIVDSSEKSRQKFATAVVWNKIIDPTEAQPWGFMDIAWNNLTYYLPRRAGLKAVVHNFTLVAMFNGSNEIYTSVDEGITWKKTALAAPDGFKADVVTLASKDKILYITAYNNETKKRQVWRGYLERDMWK